MNRSNDNIFFIFHILLKKNEKKFPFLKFAIDIHRVYMDIRCQIRLSGRSQAQNILDMATLPNEKICMK